MSFDRIQDAEMQLSKHSEVVLRFFEVALSSATTHVSASEANQKHAILPLRFVA